MPAINNERELAAAINDGRDEIIIKGEFGGKEIRIKATGRIAWDVVIASLTLPSQHY